MRFKRGQTSVIIQLTNRTNKSFTRSTPQPFYHRAFSTTTINSTNQQNISTDNTSTNSSNHQSDQQSNQQSNKQQNSRRNLFALFLIPASVVGAYCLYTMTESPRKMIAALKAAQGYHETILTTKFDAPTLPESAPQWLRELAVNPAFSYKDVEAVFPVEDHLIYDALQHEDCVNEYYHFLENIKDSTQPPEIRVAFHLGTKLCGHRGIVHGGLTATLIDQVSGECAFLANGPGLFTANLNVNYTAPVIAGKYALVTAKITSQSGRKTVVGVSVTDGNGHEFAHANVLYVRPKWIPEGEKREGLIRADEVPKPAATSPRK